MRKGRRRGSPAIIAGVILLAAALALAAYNLWDSYRAGQASDRALNAMAKKMPADRVVLDGKVYIGLLEVPSCKLALPVMRDWSYANLRIAPCRYSGSAADDDLVICGHNYATHFSPLRSVAVGSDVYFTAVSGERTHYIVSNRETIQPTAVEAMIENDQNSEQTADWDLTLFTCNLGGQTRCAVRCIRK